MTSTLSFWDQRFAEPGYKYGTAPNAFLQEQASRLAPASRVLVLSPEPDPGPQWQRPDAWQAI